MISVSNVYNIIRRISFPAEANKDKIFQYLKQRRAIFEQLKENHTEKIFNNHRFFQKKHNKLTFEGKPESLFKNGIVLSRQAKDHDLSIIPFRDFVKAQIMMYVVGRDVCLYASYYQGTMLTQNIKQNKTMVDYILSEVQDAIDKKHTKRSYKILLSKVLPLIEGDVLTYYLDKNNVEKEKTFTQQWQIDRYFKTKNNIFSFLGESLVIPQSFMYESILEKLTLDGLGEDVIYAPHISDQNYFFQPFAIVKTSYLEQLLDIQIHDQGYTLIFPTYSLPNDYKAKNKKYSTQAEFVKKFLEKHQVEASNFYTFIDIHRGFKMVEIEEGPEIVIPELPITIDNDNIVKHGLFPFVNKDRGYKRNHQEVAEQMNDVSLLTNIGPKKRVKLHEQQIYTLSQLYKAAQYGEVELPILSMRFLEVNHQDKVQILPLTLANKLERYDDECFVDIEFAYDKSLDYTCIYNIGILRVKNGMHKFHQLTIEKLNEDGEYELLDKFFNLVKGRTVIFHWNHTEKTMLTQAIERHEYPDGWILPECIDFYKIMKDNAIAVRGCYNLKLKSVARAMKTLNLIEHYHEDIVHGTDLSTRIIHMYETDSYDRNDPFIKRVEEYNKDDIYTMYEIIEVVRKYYD